MFAWRIAKVVKYFLEICNYYEFLTLDGGSSKKNIRFLLDTTAIQIFPFN